MEWPKEETSNDMSRWSGKARREARNLRGGRRIGAGAKPKPPEEKAVQFCHQLYPNDIALLEALRDYLGCSRSEAIRTAIRTMVAQLASLGLRITPKENTMDEFNGEFGSTGADDGETITSTSVVAIPGQTICTDCGKPFSRERKPGRPPVRCPDCRGVS